VLLQRAQAAFVARFHEFMHEGGGRRESDAVTLWQAANPNPKAVVRFAGAGWPECNAVLALLDPLAAHQLQNQRLFSDG
jgi:hypothetical protein